MTVLRLRDEGVLDLDDPLDRHLPGTPLGDRTVGQLPSHLAGASSESPGGGWERVPGTDLLDDGTTLVGHGGSMPGFLAGLWVDREEGAGALALGNTTSGLDGGLPAGLLADVRAAEPRIVDAWTPAPSPVPLELLGPWYWGPSPYVLRAVPGGLLHPGGLGRPGRAGRFRPATDGTWVGLDGYFAGETLRLDAVALDLATFVFTRTPYDPAAPVPGEVDGSGWTV